MMLVYHILPKLPIERGSHVETQFLHVKKLMQSSSMREMCTPASMTLIELWHSEILHAAWRAFSCRGEGKVLETHPTMVLWPHQSSQVKLDYLLSKLLNISQGIRQGSMFSPTIFNIMMDPLLSTLRQRNLGLSVNGLFLGAFAHADDIRTSAANIEDATDQVLTDDSFRGLRLCPRSVLYSRQVRNKSLHPVFQLVRPASQCLGVW